jgi:predicted helicase
MFEFNIDSTKTKFVPRQGYTYETAFKIWLEEIYLYRRSIGIAEHIDYFSETDIKNRFGQDITGIDHLVINHKDKNIFAVQQKLVFNIVPTNEVVSFFDCVDKLSKKFNCQIVPLFVSTRKTTETILNNLRYNKIKHFVSANPEIAARNSINYIFEGRSLYEDAPLIELCDCVMD